MSTFSPSDAALEGFRLTRENPGSVLAWSGVYFLGMLAVTVVMALGLGPQFIAFLKAGSLQTSNPETIAQFSQMLTKSWPAFIAALLLVLCVLGILTGGIYRLVLRPQEHGFAHLRLGADELRQAITHLLLVIVGISVLLLTELLITFFVRNLTGGRLVPFFQTMPGAFILAFLTMAPMAWVGVRLSLATPLAFVEKRISIIEAWKMTRGKFWPLFGMILLSLLFYFMIFVLFAIISFVIMSLAGGEAAMTAASNHSVGSIVAMVGVLLIQLILPILQAVTVYAPFAVAYEQLKAS
jgi:hypothetical protein